MAIAPIKGITEVVRFRATPGIYRHLEALGYHDAVVIPAELHSRIAFYHWL
jgi:hypothetical protein